MLFKPTFWLKSVLQIDEKFLTKNGVKALVLDMDNTLSMHGNPAAEAGVDEWLGKMRALGVKMRVVSNNTNKPGTSTRPLFTGRRCWGWSSPRTARSR